MFHEQSLVSDHPSIANYFEHQVMDHKPEGIARLPKTGCPAAKKKKWRANEEQNAKERGRREKPEQARQKVNGTHL